MPQSNIAERLYTLRYDLPEKCIEAPIFTIELGELCCYHDPMGFRR